MKHIKVCKYLLLIMMVVGVLTGDSEAQTFPKPKGLVNDYAGVMRASTIPQLESILLNLKAQTGAEIAVVTVPDMGGVDESTYAVQLMKAWGVGSKEKNDGILLLVAVKERRIRIEVGYGLEGVITDGTAGQIRDNYMTPHLKQNDYDTGITNGAVAIASLIAKENGVTLEGAAVPQQSMDQRGRSRGKSSPIVNIITVIIIILLLSNRGGRGLLTGMLIGGMLGGGRRRYGGYGGGFGGGFSGGGGGGFGGFGGGFSGGGGAGGGF